MQVLYQNDANPRDLKETLDDFLAAEKASEASAEFVRDLVNGTVEHLPEIDAMITKHATNWGVKRMGRVDRNVMRMALYEMLFCDEIPPVVSINEAVDIAKEFGTKESGKFVNGILDRVREGLTRSSRKAGAGKEADAKKAKS